MAEISEVTARLLDYVSYDTQSEDDRESIPSTKKQFELAHKLAGELKELGASQVRISEQGYVYACIPSNLEEGKTCPLPGLYRPYGYSSLLLRQGCKAAVHPGLTTDRNICLNREQDLWMRTADFPDLKAYEGKTLITTDGTTLLGADDKAGIAEIMTMAAYFLGTSGSNSTVQALYRASHRTRRWAGEQTALMWMAFGAGCGLHCGRRSAGGAGVRKLQCRFRHGSTVHGANIHPGTAKGTYEKRPASWRWSSSHCFRQMRILCIQKGMRVFIHLDRMTGCVEEARMDYIIRDHDRAKFERRKELFSPGSGISEPEIWFRTLWRQR